MLCEVREHSEVSWVAFVLIVVAFESSLSLSCLPLSLLLYQLLPSFARTSIDDTALVLLSDLFSTPLFPVSI
jgi:hypothetical protein